MEDIREEFLKHAADLWATHQDDFARVLSDAESQKINLSFTAKLDFSEVTAKLHTNLSYSQVVKDSREKDFDDPNQPRLPGVIEEAEAEQEQAAPQPKRGRGRPRKQKQAAEAAAE